MLSTALAKGMMKLAPRYGDPSDLHLQEIFEHDVYRKADPEEQLRIRLRSSQFTYDYEGELGFFDHYFPSVKPEEFAGCKMLDLGCFSGGRMTHWVERYKLSEGHGIDVDPVYAEAGNDFAKSKNINAKFVHGVGERLPYPDDYFDYVASYDVFEHVQDLVQVMNEIWRVLKPGGRLLTVFPPYYNPLEAHLRLTTSLHGLHLLFSGKAITRAYYDIIKERGHEAAWYARKNPEPADWEKSPGLNGITVKRFRNIVTSRDWEMQSWGVNSLVSHGRKSKKQPYKTIAGLMKIPAHLPILEEVFLGRVCCVLKKPIPVQ